METKLFLRIRFWVQFLFRNQISIKTSRLRNNVLTRFSPRTTKSFSLCVLILKSWLCSKFFIENKSLKWNFQKKRNQILKQTFSCTMKIWEENFKKSVIELRILPSGRIRIKNFANNHTLEKKSFPETQLLSSIFIEKSDFDEKVTSEKKTFWLSLLSKKNKFFIFRAYFGRHDLDANFSLKIKVSNQFFWKNESYSEANFFLQNEILKWHFFKISDCHLRIYCPGRHRKQNFLNNLFLEKVYFPEAQVLSSFFIEKSDFNDKFTSEKKTFDSVYSAKRTNFSFFVLILEGMIWTQLFSLKIRVSNDFSGKTNHILKQTFSYKMRFWNDIFSKFQIVNWEFFVPADSIIQNFSNNHILEKDYCPETQFLSSIFIEKSDFDQKFKSEKKNVLTQFAPGKTT